MFRRELPNYQKGWRDYSKAVVKGGTITINPRGQRKIALVLSDGNTLSIERALPNAKPYVGQPGRNN